MKVSEKWLREIVNTNMPLKELADTLTMVGFEVEEINKIDGVNILDVHLSANRGDALSIIGLSREISTFTKKNINLPSFSFNENLDININSFIKIHVANPELCQRYAGRIIKNIKVAPSPSWLQKRLIEMGVRPINNVVDATNYIMLEIGQPLHAFDLSTIKDGEIIVRTAKTGEKLTTLDDIERNLDDSCLVIANSQKPMVLAGIMGGSEYEITESTVDIFLESASFDRKTVRKTARREGLNTESSYRFERIVDPHNVVNALNRAANMIQELAGGDIASGIIDITNNLPAQKHITTKYKRLNSILGTEITAQEMIDILTCLGMDVTDNGDNMTIEVPTFRADIYDEWDIAEEVARHYGYQNITATVPGDIVKSGRIAPELEFENKLRAVLSMSGLCEGLSYSLFDLKTLNLMNISEDNELRKNIIKLNNPKSEEYTHLRPTMFISALEALQNNTRRGLNDAQIFEIGRIFKDNNDSFKYNFTPHERTLDVTTKVTSKNGMPGERRVAMIAAMGKGFSGEWNGEKRNIDFYWIKGILEQIFLSLNIKNIEYIADTHQTLHQTRTAKAVSNGITLALFGQIHQEVAENFDLPKNSFIAEIYTDELMKTTIGTTKLPPLSRYPSISRDISFVIKKEIVAVEVEKIILANAGDFLENLTLFDLYQGKGINDDEVSLAYHLTFRSVDRTLSDEEIDVVMQKILSNLISKANAKQR